mmetsp:Transcript_40543/g.100831  ORF Transcript_40543/g.100831 Transcript_40543/m.100831 type:complete len:202 (-) Transcript_40543:159-764(-)
MTDDRAPRGRGPARSRSLGRSDQWTMRCTRHGRRPALRLTSRLNRPRDLIHEMAAWRSPAARLRGLQRLQRLQRRRHTIAVSTAKGSCAGRAGHQAIRPAPLPARSCCQPFGYRQPREPQPSDRRSTRSHRAAGAVPSQRANPSSAAACHRLLPASLWHHRHVWRTSERDRLIADRLALFAIRGADGGEAHHARHQRRTLR